MKPNTHASASNVDHRDEPLHTHFNALSLSGKAAKSGRPVRIQMLGGGGVGKTCFLAGLALLNEQTDGRSFVLPTDDITMAVLDRLRGTLAAGVWPAKTSIVDELSCAVVRGKSRVDVKLSDFAGDNFTDSMKRGDTSEAARQIKTLVSNADLLLVLLDGATVDSGEDFAGAPLIQAVFERIKDEGAGDLEVAIVLTKSDLCSRTPIKTSDDLKQLVQNRVPDLARFLHEQGIHTQWIPISVCGPNAIDASGAPIYASLAPQGYEAIFDQLFRRKNRWRNRLIQRVAAAAVLVMVMGVACMILRGQKVAIDAKDIDDPTKPITENTTPVAPENEFLVRQRYDTEFDKAINDIEASGNVESVELILKRFEEIPVAHKILVASGLERLKSRASDRKEQLLYQLVVDCQQLQTGDCAPLIGKYLSDFPDGLHAVDLRKMRKDINLARYYTAREQVKAVPVTSTEALRKKISAITDFMKDYGQLVDSDEKANMSAARDIAAELVMPRQYHCKLIRTSGMDGPRDHGVKVLVDQEQILWWNDSGDVSEKNWNRNFTIDWQAGKPIQVKLMNCEGWDTEMAYFENNTPIAIVLLATTNGPTRYSTEKNFMQDFTMTRPLFKIAFECQELPQEKLKIISAYLLPGDKW